MTMTGKESTHTHKLEVKIWFTLKSITEQKKVILGPGNG